MMLLSRCFFGRWLFFGKIIGFFIACNYKSFFFSVSQKVVRKCPLLDALSSILRFFQGNYHPMRKPAEFLLLLPNNFFVDILFCAASVLWPIWFGCKNVITWYKQMFCRRKSLKEHALKKQIPRDIPNPLTFFPLLFVCLWNNRN